MIGTNCTCPKLTPTFDFDWYGSSNWQHFFCNSIRMNWKGKGDKKTFILFKASKANKKVQTWHRLRGKENQARWFKEQIYKDTYQKCLIPPQFLFFSLCYEAVFRQEWINPCGFLFLSLQNFKTSTFSFQFHSSTLVSMETEGKNLGRWTSWEQGNKPL